MKRLALVKYTILAETRKRKMVGSKTIQRLYKRAQDPVLQE